MKITLSNETDSVAVTTTEETATEVLRRMTGAMMAVGFVPESVRDAVVTLAAEYPKDRDA